MLIGEYLRNNHAAVRIDGALVHLNIEGESTPTPDPLCRCFLTTDGVWASGSQHAI